MADIISKDPISNEYVDRVIKANEILDENSANTQGVQLRLLVKDLRDRLETQVEKSNAAIAEKVDKKQGMDLSERNFTEEDASLLGSINNWILNTNGDGFENYIDQQVINPYNSRFQIIEERLNGQVVLIEALGDLLVNTETTSNVESELSVKREDNTIVPYFGISVPAEWYGAAGNKGILKVSGTVLVKAKNSASWDLRYKIKNRTNDTELHFLMINENLNAGEEKLFKFEISLIKGNPAGTYIQLTLNGIPFSQQFYKEIRNVEVDWGTNSEDTNRDFNFVNFFTYTGTTDAEISIIGLSGEFALLKNI